MDIQITEWKMAKDLDYQPITDIWERLCKAEQKNLFIAEVINIFNEVKTDYKKLTELVMAVNHKSFYFYKADEPKDSESNRICKWYVDMYYILQDYVFDTLKGDELDYYLTTTD